MDLASFLPQRRASPTRTSSSSCTQICCASRSVPTRKRCNAFFADNKSKRSQSLKLRQKIAIRELTFSLRLVRMRLPSHSPTLFLYVFAPFRRVPVIVYCMELARPPHYSGWGWSYLSFFSVRLVNTCRHSQDKPVDKYSRSSPHDNPNPPNQH